ncbi:Cathepsin_L [Hexamita inflata]|uniref:Cathepsin L n=1 Tax=Hexamita inflata TaxID=28002 RepID=A0AA86NSM2_9EUKA|nr:Cathepsin L [Hexamita inflata]
MLLIILSKQTNQHIHSLNSLPTDFCAADNPFQHQVMYESMDLREASVVTKPKNQGACNSSYAFQTIALLETSMLNDITKLSSFWQDETKKSTFSLSEQFLMSNSFVGCYYCNGGSLGSAMRLLQKSGKTVDLTSNFPYDFQSYQSQWNNFNGMASKIFPTNYFVPAQSFSNSGSNKDSCDSSNTSTLLVRLYDDSSAPFDQTVQNDIKSVLSRGFAVAIQMQTNDEFINFNGGQVIHSDCDSFQTNHSAVIIGFGKKQNKYVWVVKNSYGEEWGDKGYFFIEIGMNSFCAEHSAYTVISKDYDVNSITRLNRGTLNRQLSHTLDCDQLFTNVSGVITCVGSCPDDYKYTQDGLECLQKCPDAAPYANEQLSNMCQDVCSTGAYSFNITAHDLGEQALFCNDSCTNYFIINASNSNSKQCVDSCPQGQTPSNQQCVGGCTTDAPYKEASSCVARCSTAAYEASGSDLICVSSCSGMYITNTSNQNSKKCITVCPSDVPYYETGACVVKCTTGSYHVVSGATQSLVCQESCTNYVFNTSNDNSKQCLDTCPDDLPFSDSGKCVARCMSGAYQVFSSLSQTLVCQSSCTLYVFNTTNSNSKQCLSSCPLDAPYSDAGLCSARCTSGNYSNSTGSFVCQGACANYFIINASNSNSKQCVDSCPQGQTPSNQQCVGGCTTDAPYKEASSCVARCSTAAYEASGSDLICVSSCSGMYITNTSNQNSKKCITVCPSDVPYYETGACVVKCTTGSYHVVSGATQSLVCQESCTNYVFNTSNDNSKQCLDTCPDDLPFSDSGKCVARCMSGAYQVFSSLSQTLVCQSSCTLYVFNTTNSNSKQCLSSCPSDAPYSDAGLCSARCTSGNYSNSTGSFVCQGACANYFIINASNSNSKQCVDSCPQGQTPSNQQCTPNDCPADTPYIQLSSCVSRCSTGAYEIRGSNMFCVASCPDMYITNSSNLDSQQCISICPTDYPYYQIGACVIRCKTGYYTFFEQEQQQFRCRDICSYYVINSSNWNSKQCFSKCPDYAPYSNTGSCVARCSSGAYQVFPTQLQTLQCQIGCVYYVLNASNQNSKQCVQTCPDPFLYSDLGLCSRRCPSGAYFVSNNIFTCTSSCQVYFVTNTTNSNSKQCVDSCSYCGRQANFDFKKYQLFQNYFLYQFQLYINSMFSSVSFLFYYFFQPFGHRVNQMIDDIQRDLLQRPLYFFIQQVICGTFFRGNV